jgi:hypothetical protein
MALLPAGTRNNLLAVTCDKPLSPPGFRHIAADMR